MRNYNVVMRVPVRYVEYTYKVWAENETEVRRIVDEQDENWYDADMSLTHVETDCWNDPEVVEIEEDDNE